MRRAVDDKVVYDTSAHRNAVGTVDNQNIGRKFDRSNTQVEVEVAVAAAAEHRYGGVVAFLTGEDVPESAEQILRDDARTFVHSTHVHKLPQTPRVEEARTQPCYRKASLPETRNRFHRQQVFPSFPRTVRFRDNIDNPHVDHAAAQTASIPDNDDYVLP